MTLSGGQSVNYTYKYESGKYQAGVYTMKVKVHRHHERMVAFGEMKFNLTKNMVGEIIVQQDDFEDNEAFAVNKLINFTAVIYDPNGFFLDRRSTFLYNFTTAGDYRISVMIIAIGLDGGENFQNKFKTKWGHFTKDITVKEPISKINVSGNTWLKHGDLLNINVSCDGSDPSFEYCWEIVPFNESKANFTCTDPIVTTTCNFIIVRYFHEVGLHYIKTFFKSGEVASADKEAASYYLEKFKAMIDEGSYTSQTIFTVDETGLFWKKMPKRTFIEREERTFPGFKAAKDQSDGWRKHGWRKQCQEPDEIGDVIEEVVDLARQINLEVDSDDVQELLDSHNQELTIDELIEMR
ncbi:uncharacterized protein LOC111620476 [Centruroides sculpturatus]|uniref:uncharacterized protein LOC111620476 n=1 Tax=Centruroides sculpturatus TaxID=218467 RepID=UPI000C6C9A54|nr:uncharacterized protein LOC111620476 [Centruroides sculpturatus]